MMLQVGNKRVRCSCHFRNEIQEIQRKQRLFCSRLHLLYSIYDRLLHKFVLLVSGDPWHDGMYFK